MTENLATDLNFTRLCRCCALEHNLMYDIFCGKCSNAQTYYEVIMECTSIQFFRDDGLPSLVCHECVSILESFVVFRKKCIESESIFKQMSENVSPDEQETFDFDRMKQDDLMLDIVKEELNDVGIATKSDDRSSGKYPELKLFDEIKIENRPDTNSQIDRSDSEIDQRSIVNFATVKEEFIDDERDESKISYIDTEERTDACDESLNRKQKFDKHQKTQTGEMQCTCDRRKKSFKYKSNSKHHNIHTDEKQYSCWRCDKSFMDKSNLLHRKVHAGIKSYSCDKCGKSFARKGYLDKHRKTHTGKKPFSCDECAKSFTQKGDLTKHKKRHAGVKPYSCDVCGKAFVRKWDLNMHWRTHSDEKPFSCELCGKSFTFKWNLSLHQRIHTDVRPFACDMCEKAFTRKGLLNRHQKIHTGEKPYLCDKCSKSFMFKRDFNKHQRRHAGERLP